MRSAERGFTLIEVVVATFLIAISVIALAPLFVYGARTTAAAGRLGSSEALAVERMERLRSTPYQQLLNGGSLDADLTGYFDAADSAHLLRWTIADKPGGPAAAKVITVRAAPSGPLAAGARDAVLVAVRVR